MLCVYCSKSDDFNDEHVFPASLGGDDSNYILRCVCRTCNNDFSPLEEELTRRSPIAIARNFNPHPGRRGKKSDPVFQPIAMYIQNDDGVLAFDVAAGQKLTPALYPQLLIDGETIHLTACTESELHTFIKDISALIGAESFNLIEKISTNTFKINIIRKEGTHFFIGPDSVSDKPSYPGLWFTEAMKFHTENETTTSRVIHPRFYRHKSGSLNYKTIDRTTLCTDLAKAWQFLNAPNKFENFRDVVIDGPIAKVEASFDISKAARAIAKIGFNFLIFAAGHTYARDPAFDEVKSAILSGEPALKYDSIPEHEAEIMLGRAIEGSHVAMLYSLPIGAGRSAIFAIIRFYGSITHLATLSTSAPDPGWRMPLYYVIDYNNGVISQWDGMTYIKLQQSQDNPL